MNEKKIRIAVVFGGKSGEHEVSLASAKSVMQAIDSDRYEIVPIGITKQGRWITQGDPMALLIDGQAETAATEPTTPDNRPDATAVTAATGSRELVPGASAGRFPQVDVVFPVLHGTYGEDGSVQGLLELAGLPYVGAGILGSVLGLDKTVMKQVLQAEGIPLVDSVAIRRSEWRADPDGAVALAENRFSYPMFVKPASCGSSVGVSKAHDRAELIKGLALAARFDRKVLVEEAIDAREIECAVLGNEQPIASVLGEVVPSNEFYDYAAKYLDGDSALCIPADLPEETTQHIRELAVKAFLATDCAGMARVDFFVSHSSGQVYLNELNTIPGFTQISMYPKLWEASGLPYPRLIDRLIELAIERYDDQQTTETTYTFDH